MTAPSGSSSKLVMWTATTQWLASNGSGFQFQTDPKAQTTSVSPRLGKVGNGVFG